MGYGAPKNYGNSGTLSGTGIPFVDVGTGSFVIAVSVGFDHTCAVLDNNKVKCWGKNGYYQLGYGDTTVRGSTIDTMGDNLPFVNLGTDFAVVDVCVSTANTAKSAVAVSCALSAAGTVKCWGTGKITSGYPLYESSGIGMTPEQMGDDLPVMKFGTSRYVTQMSCGEYDVCVILDNDDIKCWGESNEKRGYHSGNEENVIPVTSLPDTASVPASVDCGMNHCCVLMVNGKVTCFGLGTSAGLANVNGPTPILDFGTTETQDLRIATQIHVGQRHTCALLSDNSVTCWGVNYAGRLGFENEDNRGSDTAHWGANLLIVSLIPQYPTLAVYTGTSISCALLSDHNLRCWGENYDGKLGIGTDAWNTWENVGDWPNTMGSALVSTKLAADVSSTCVSPTVPAQYSDPLVCSCDVCARTQVEDAVAQLSKMESTPVQRSTVASPQCSPHMPCSRMMSAGTDGTLCAIVDDAADQRGQLKCWGMGGAHMGYGDTVDRGANQTRMGTFLPYVDLGTDEFVIAVSVGGRHTCAVLGSNNIKCWGENVEDELGYGDTRPRGGSSADDRMGDNLPTVDLGTNFSVADVCVVSYTTGMLRLYTAATCALSTVGTIKCWGSGYVPSNSNSGGSLGQMGDNLPVMDFGASRFATSMSCLEGDVCVILDNNVVKCWGKSSSTRGYVPEDMGDNLAAIALPDTGSVPASIECGQSHCCVLLLDGTVRCFMPNQKGIPKLGQMGPVIYGNDGVMIGSVLDLGVGRTATQITVGDLHSCALLDNKTIKCWGRNHQGQLGVGTNMFVGREEASMGDNMLSPLLPTGLTPLAVYAGYEGTCALMDDHKLRCWGSNQYGMLGAGREISLGSVGDDAGEMGDNLGYVDLDKRVTGTCVSQMVPVQYSDPLVCNCSVCAKTQVGENVFLQSSTISICPKNHWCFDQKQYACPIYSNSPTASDAITDCQCNAGYVGQNGDACTVCEKSSFCVGGNSSQLCPSNAWSPVGSDSLVDCTCLDGFFYVAGSGVKQPHDVALG